MSAEESTIPAVAVKMEEEEESTTPAVAVKMEEDAGAGTTQVKSEDDNKAKESAMPTVAIKMEEEEEATAAPQEEGTTAQVKSDDNVAAKTSKKNEQPPSSSAVDATIKSEEQATAATVASTLPSLPATTAKLLQELPKNRFELELEFVQALASPAYLHYLATNPSSDDHNWLDDPEFVEFLRYLLKVWSRPEYNRFLVYPQALYFLEWMLQHRREEWAQIGFRNFAHQQQFMSWQHRASRLYGRGSLAAAAGSHETPTPVDGADPQQQQPQGPTLDPQTGMEVDPQPMKEG